jgi:hypothetical protein
VGRREGALEKSGLNSESFVFSNFTADEDGMIIMNSGDEIIFFYII